MSTLNQFTSMVLILASTLIYHLIQKTIPRAVNPFLSLTMTFSTAAALCAIAFLLPNSANPRAAVVRVNWLSFALGFAVVGIDLGFLLAYRSGWLIHRASVVSNVSVALLLVPVGYLLFREAISGQTLAGVCLCLVGLLLLARPL